MNLSSLSSRQQNSGILKMCIRLLQREWEQQKREAERERGGREGRLAMTYLHLHIKVDTGPSSQALSQCNGSGGGEAEPKQDLILDCVVFSGLRLHVGSNLWVMDLLSCEETVCFAAQRKSVHKCLSAAYSPTVSLAWTEEMLWEVGPCLMVLMYSLSDGEGRVSPGMALSLVCCLSEYHGLSQVAV